ncbi:PadR family transcriptional regulator [Demequina lutea]|uniref:DNA-binding PadR family transcriptional regulator n=1 Tax=Demequina lutea TaxID=431489 RepID=A0A7Z0CK23_9MICO|nr:PadR family transcriptional regulator [Demequina lutea]NYI41473.1 DNA-binding PadR family transcriptional regulator [Demequina lutea]
MGNSFRPGGSSNSGPGQAADAMWQAMNHLRTSFDKKVGTRMGRGDVRAAILTLLAEEPKHGYQLIREIEERTGGKWKPSAGSVYPTLQLLADEGLVTTEVSQDRKVYSLTEAGREEAAAAAGSAAWENTAPFDTNALGAVPKAGIELAQAVAQVVRTGTSEQHHKAAEVLNETRRKIYSILAQD